MGELIKFPFVVLWFVIKMVLALFFWSFAIVVLVAGVVLGLFFDGMNNHPASQTRNYQSRQGRQPQDGHYE